jgi:signal transduction histidine kinase
MAFSGIDARLAKERRARLQAERLLALRSEELYSANRKLSEHAHALSSQVIEQREENAALKGQTTQVAAELEVAASRAALAEQRLWDSLTAVEDGFAIFDRDCRLVVANPAFLAPFEGISDIAPGASYDAILRVVVDEGIVDIEGAEPDQWLETMLKRWERSSIPQVDVRLWNGSYVRLIDKRTPQGDTVCLGVDITSTIRRERQLQRARDAALAASQAKSTFLANMSHEIRTPMNGVVSMAELLGETDLDPNQKLYADTIRHSGEALLVIINDILDYSKIEAGKLILHEEEFDLAGGDPRDLRPAAPRHGGSRPRFQAAYRRALDRQADRGLRALAADPVQPDRQRREVHRDRPCPRRRDLRGGIRRTKRWRCGCRSRTRGSGSRRRCRRMCSGNSTRSRKTRTEAMTEPAWASPSPSGW